MPYENQAVLGWPDDQPDWLGRDKPKKLGAGRFGWEENQSGPKELRAWLVLYRILEPGPADFLFFCYCICLACSMAGYRHYLVTSGPACIAHREIEEWELLSCISKASLARNINFLHIHGAWMKTPFTQNVSDSRDGTSNQTTRGCVLLDWLGVSHHPLPRGTNPINLMSY